jgi:membrane protein DedA with SNARE-associated domain
VASFVFGIIASTGYLGLALLMLAENLFPPLPSELILPLAGYMAGRDQLAIGGVIAVGTIGSVLGTLPLFILGRRLGEDRVRELARKHGRWLTVSPADIDRARDWLRRHGAWAVLLARLVPGIRSLVALPAGVARMRRTTFLVCTTVGAAIWTGFLALAGYLLGSRFHVVERYLDPVSWVVLVVVAVTYAVRVVRWGRRAPSPGRRDQKQALQGR